MEASASRSQLLLARMVIGLILACLMAGAIFYGVAADTRERFWTHLYERPSGPMAFRFILQPVMAVIAAVIDGTKDGRSGRSPYLLTVVANPAERGERLREGLIATARIMLIGLVVDTVYQLTVLDRFYPGETVAVTVALAFLPYVLARGPVARMTRQFRAQSKPSTGLPDGDQGRRGGRSSATPRLPTDNHIRSR